MIEDADEGRQQVGTYGDNQRNGGTVMLSNLAIWYLRKRKASVLLNYRLAGGDVHQLTNRSFIYDCAIRDDVDYRLPNGEDFTIPEGAYQVKKPL